MTLSALALLAIVAVAAGWSGRRWLARSVAAVAVLLFLAISCGPLTDTLLYALQSPYRTSLPVRWAPRNVIVVLAAGTTRLDETAALVPSLYANGRLIKAITLYHSCRAAERECMVLVCGGDPQQHGTAEASVYAATLVGLGLPAVDVQVETASHNTYENARFSRPLVILYDPQRLLLVTSGLHLRRSLLMFSHFGMQPLPVAGDVVRASFSLWPLASNMDLFDTAMHEYGGIAKYYLDNLTGKNSPRITGPLLPAPLLFHAQVNSRLDVRR